MLDKPGMHVSLFILEYIAFNHSNTKPTSARKDDASLSQPTYLPGALMERFNASLQRGRESFCKKVDEFVAQAERG